MLLIKLNFKLQSNPQNRIINGAPNSLPFVCRVISIDGPIGETEQGRLYTGFFINARRVVTVALAIEGFSNWRIEYGSNIVEEQTFINSNTAVVFPTYSRDILQDNVGIIDLSEDALITSM